MFCENFFFFFNLLLIDIGFVWHINTEQTYRDHKLIEQSLGKEDYKEANYLVPAHASVNSNHWFALLSADALRVARKFDCRYIETSAALNHHVDELLVGILSQIRQQIAPSASGLLAPPGESKARSRSKSPGKAISDFFSKIFGGSDKKAKSCETLFVQ